MHALYVDNAALARALWELAELLEVSGEPQFRVRAFRNAARAIESLQEPAAELLRKGRLQEVPGIGPGVARRVGELIEKGKLAEVVELQKSTPRGELVRIDGVGPKSAELMYKQLGIGTVEQLEEAARAGRLRQLPRFSEKREQKILRGIEAFRRASGRWKVTQAWPHAEFFLERIRGVPGVVRAEACGTLRRRRDTVGDIDLLVAAPDAARVMEAVCTAPGVEECLARGDTKSSVKLREGVQVDVRVVAPESWGAALHYFTGSKEHNVAMRGLAIQRGLKINEYGVWDAEERRVGGAEEAEVFAKVGLPWIPPELRENRGEIEAAQAGRLPKLIEVADVRGDLHMHTVETDGRATLEEMVEAARKAGREYIAITDHSQALAMARGLDAARLRAQGRQIRELNEKLGGKPLVLRGIEADILADGSVDLGNEVLRELDWVVASVHSQFGLPREEQTRRIVRALESGVVDVLGHPTGRKIGHRLPYEIDLEVILAAAKRVGAAVEVNAYPDRLDLDDTHVRMAREAGVPLIISTDSHATTHLPGIHWGVSQARRGWAEAKDVANTLPASAFLAKFGHHHDRG
jgi:DNA polymerase (family X)